ncbi:MAG: phosphopantothenoylcysteine decarboxylase [Planctomycetales bacterium]|nr:phosphopantothenoylcysteine decarboxylase [Planctomycetales bacterium]
MSPKRIVVGIGGGIAAYKSAALVSRLVQQGLAVDVVLTHGAAQFVGAATFAALCGRAPTTEAFDERYPLGPHIELAETADLLVIAPATARLLASCALGLADDLLSTLYLARTCPVLMAPAMSAAMWDQPSVQRNVATLQCDGVQLVGPTRGWLSCRKQGLGRMEEPEGIWAAIEAHLQ